MKLGLGLLSVHRPHTVPLVSNSMHFALLDVCFFVARKQLLCVGCLISLQHASVSQGRICFDNGTCGYFEIEAADQTNYLTQSHLYRHRAIQSQH